jgi:hypothetical protein
MESARSHFSKANREFLDQSGFRVAPHQPYSPDITPSNFSIFGDLKQQMQKEKFESFAAVKKSNEETLRGIPADMYWRVFDYWIEKLERIIKYSGTYHEFAMHVSKIEDE